MAAIRRIYAMFLRHIYLIRHSPPRLIAIICWPTLQILTWGFFNKFLLLQTSTAAFTLSTLLGASLFAIFFERTNSQVMWTFIEDIWSRNIGNILITPIKNWQLLVSYLFNGTVSTLIGMVGSSIFAYLFFDYSIAKLGIYGLFLMFNLIFCGWSIGLLLIAMVLRYGSSSEFFGWIIASLLLPFVAVYYPVSILPPMLQHISWALPPSYMFESLRELIKTGVFNWDYFYTALKLNIFYFILCIAIFLWQLHQARRRGGLFSMGE